MVYFINSACLLLDRRDAQTQSTPDRVILVTELFIGRSSPHSRSKVSGKGDNPGLGSTQLNLHIHSIKGERSLLIRSPFDVFKLSGVPMYSILLVYLSSKQDSWGIEVNFCLLYCTYFLSNVALWLRHTPENELDNEWPNRSILPPSDWSFTQERNIPYSFNFYLNFCKVGYLRYWTPSRSDLSAWV